jgi:cell division protein FtsN
MMIVDLGDKGQWYRVRIGAFANKDAAGKYLEEMKDKEGIADAYVVKNEQ